MTKVLVVLSGGQDSTTCLFAAVREFGQANVTALTIDYDQRHKIELESAARVASLSGVLQEVVTVGPVLKGTSPLTNPGEQLEQYADHQSLPGGLEKTFVPSRNLLFMVLASNRAYINDQSLICMGLSQEDYGGYPDCREGFISAMEVTLKEGLEKDITFWTPLLHMTKAESILWALSMPGCYHALAYSHTAYDGAYPPTGHDHATLLRAKGFEEAGVPDPLLVRAYREKAIPLLPRTPNYMQFDEQIDNLPGDTIDDELRALEKIVADSARR